MVPHLNLKLKIMQGLIHSKKEKSALLLISDPWSMGYTPVYVPLATVEHLEVGEEIQIPDGYKIVDWQTVTTSSGEEVMLKRLAR